MKLRTKLLSILAVMLCVCFVTNSGYGSSEPEKGLSAGTQAGNEIKSMIDSSGEINERIAKPLTSSGTPMKTYGPQEQQQTFNAQLTAPSSNSFLEVLAQPASSGDLAEVRIKQDTDFDDSPDYAYNLSVRVSGVCANGIVSCDAGTWDNCSYYKWTADDGAKISLAPADSIADLSACYCINNNCGGNLVWNNLDIILKDLGGGVVSAIHTKDPQYTITNVSTDGPVIKYYGQKTGEKGTDFPYQTTLPGEDPDGVYLSGSTSPDQYYQGGMGTLPVDDEVNRQSGDANSYYSRLVDSFDTQPNVTYTTCVITHTPSVITHTQNHGGNGSDVWPVDHYIYIRIINDNGIIRYQWEPTSPDGVVGWNCGPTDWKDVGTTDIRSLAPASGLSQQIDVYFQAMSNQCSVGTGSINNLNANTRFLTCAAKGCQFPTVTFNYNTTVKTDEATFNTNDQCTPDSSCRLQEEKVCDDSGMNCVQTWRDFNPTGLSPFPMCKQITSDIETYTACLDGSTATLYDSSSAATIIGSGSDIWWHIERVYECEADNEYNLSDALARTKHITGSVQDNTTSMYYEDYTPATGEISGYNVDLIDMGSYENCEKACKVKKPLPDTQAGVGGTTSDYRTTTDSYVYEYKRCDNNVCPLEEGETIVKGCTCMNEFAEAASIMQVLSDASKDLICSEN